MPRPMTVRHDPDPEIERVPIEKQSAGQEVRLIGPEAFSFLIRRFGMLSVSHTGTKRVGGNFSFRSNWSFVKTLVRDKQNTYDLSSRDLFWLVSACARANGLDSVLVDSGGRFVYPFPS